MHYNTEGLGAGHTHWGSGSGWLVRSRQRGPVFATSLAGKALELERLISAELDSGQLGRSERHLPDEADNLREQAVRLNMSNAPFLRWNDAVDASYTCHLTM